MHMSDVRLNFNSSVSDDQLYVGVPYHVTCNITNTMHRIDTVKYIAN